MKRQESEREVMFRRTKKVEFVGGPFDGHRQSLRISSKDWGERLAIPVSENVFRLLAGDSKGAQAPASSVAVYELRDHKRKYYYYFVEARSPEEYELQNQKV